MYVLFDRLGGGALRDLYRAAMKDASLVQREATAWLGSVGVGLGAVHVEVAWAPGDLPGISIPLGHLVCSSIGIRPRDSTVQMEGHMRKVQSCAYISLRDQKLLARYELVHVPVDAETAMEAYEYCTKLIFDSIGYHRPLLAPVWPSPFSPVKTYCIPFCAHILQYAGALLLVDESVLTAASLRYMLLNLAGGTVVSEYGGQP